MASDPLFRDRVHHPEMFFSRLLRKFVRGDLQESDENPSFLFRATVVAVDTAGGQLQNERGVGSISHTVDGDSSTFKAIVGVRNPRNSVKARMISGGLDQFMGDERLRVFWPFFPEHVTVPVKPGEHVYVMFEDPEFEHGLWISKVPGQENINFFRGQRGFVDNSRSSTLSAFSDTQAARPSAKYLDTDLAAGESQIKKGRLLGLFR